MNKSLSTMVQLTGTDQAFVCETGDTLLTGGLRAGLGLPYECSVGACGCCKVELIEGEVEELYPDAPGLKPKDRRKNKVLACQCRPVSDVVIKTSPQTEYVPRIKPLKKTMTFVGKRSLGSDMDEFTFRSESQADFLPGQYAVFDIHGVDGVRAYSMSNLPNDQGIWQFIIKRVDGGACTGVLFDELEPESLVEVDGPYGTAFLQQGNYRDVVCIAAGSGLAPMLSVARGFIDADDSCDNQLNFVLGMRHINDINLDEIVVKELNTASNVFTEITLSDKETASSIGWQGSVGYVQDVIREQMADKIHECEIYLAGPAEMLNDTVRMLVLDMKVDVDRVHYDRFF